MWVSKMYEVRDADGEILGTFDTRKEAVGYRKSLTPKIRRERKELVGTTVFNLDGGSWAFIVREDELVESISGVPLPEPQPNIVLIRHLPTGKDFKPGSRAVGLFLHDLLHAKTKIADSGEAPKTEGE
jgi:hypothetical protein